MSGGTIEVFEHTSDEQLMSGFARRDHLFIDQIDAVLEEIGGEVLGELDHAQVRHIRSERAIDTRNSVPPCVAYRNS
jgi:hypothetical protein